MKIKVRYKDQWYWATNISIDREGNVSFEYLHDLEGVVDPEYVKATILYLDNMEMDLVKLEVKK